MDRLKTIASAIWTGVVAVTTRISAAWLWTADVIEMFPSGALALILILAALAIFF